MMERISRGFKPFRKGDSVWLESKYLKLRHESKKLAPKREGPFLITEVLNPPNYRLSLPKSWRIHPVFHASLLSPFRNNDIHGENYPQPPPDLINDQLEYEVEAIIAHRRSGRSHQYLIMLRTVTPRDSSRDISLSRLFY